MQDWQENKERERRFDAYAAALGNALGHADRVGPLLCYLTGLLSVEGRKSIEPIAAAVPIDDKPVSARRQSLTHFVGQAPWDDAAVLKVADRYALAPMLKQGPITAWVFDDSGIPKKGEHSVGVSRQYCGNLGKVDNCQVAVTLSLVNERFSLPVGYRLYLPKVWAEDPERREKAGVPESIRFQTKPEIAIDLLDAAKAARFPLAPVAADAGYGDNPNFRSALTSRQVPYLVGIQSDTRVWPPGKGPMPPDPTVGRLTVGRDTEHQPVSVWDLARSLPETAFRTAIWRVGTQGDLSSRFAVMRVRPAHAEEELTEARPEEWLLIEWPTGEEKPDHYWLGTLDGNACLQELVEFAKLRWRIERDYEELKQELGLDQYEGRGWRGFHHHGTLCIASYAFLVAERAAFPPLCLRKGGRVLPESTLPENYRPRGAAPRRTPPADVDRYVADPPRT